MEKMGLLSVDVNLPSSSSSGIDELLKEKDADESASYEVVDYAEIHFPDLRHTKRLGRGAYGTVIACLFRGSPAAAKLVETNVDFKTVRAEAERLHEFRSDHIIQLYALFHGEMCGLVLELMEGGSLNELLHQHRHIRYQTCHVLNWAVQASVALGYLHAHNFIHRDIKPSNMLLTRDYIGLKLCDFGTVAEQQTSMTNNRGTAAWMAPEVFRGRKYNQQCDIFSLGISLWEMVARRQPFADLLEANPLTVLWKVAESGLRPDRIDTVPEPLMELIERCWANDPAERPCLEEVQKTLEAFLEGFPNANLLPLVDRSTGKAAVADPLLCWGHTPPSTHMQIATKSAATLYPQISLGIAGSEANTISSEAAQRRLVAPSHQYSQLMSSSIADTSNLLNSTPYSSFPYQNGHQYCPNTTPTFGLLNSYNPCLTRSQYLPPIVEQLPDSLALDGADKKRKKSHSITKFLSDLKKMC